MPITITNNNAYTAILSGKKVSKNSDNSKSVLDDCIAVLNNNTPSLTQSSHIRDFRSMTFKFKECLRRENGEKQRSGMLVYLTKTLAEQKSESSIDLNSFHRAMQLGNKSCLKESHLGNNLVVLPVLLGSSLEKKKAVEKEFCSTVTEFVKEPDDKGKKESLYKSVKRLMEGNGFIGKDAKNSLDDFCIHYMGASVYPRIIEEVGKVIELTEAEQQKLKNNPEEVIHYLYSGENVKKDKIIELLKNQFINARGSNEKAFKLRLLINAMESKITLIKPLRGIHNEEPQPSTSTVRQGPTPKPRQDQDSDVPHHYPSVINNNNNNNIIDLAPVIDLVRDLIKKSNSDSNDASVKKPPAYIHLTDLMTGLKNAKSRIAPLNSQVAGWQTEKVPRAPQEVIDPIIPEMPTMVRADIIMPSDDEMDGSHGKSSGYGSSLSVSTSSVDEGFFPNDNSNELKKMLSTEPDSHEELQKETIRDATSSGATRTRGNPSNSSDLENTWPSIRKKIDFFESRAGDVPVPSNKTYSLEEEKSGRPPVINWDTHPKSSQLNGGKVEPKSPPYSITSSSPATLSRPSNIQATVRAGTIMSSDDEVDGFHGESSGYDSDLSASTTSLDQIYYPNNNSNELKKTLSTESDLHKELRKETIREAAFSGASRTRGNPSNSSDLEDTWPSIRKKIDFFESRGGDIPVPPNKTYSLEEEKNGRSPVINWDTHPTSSQLNGGEGVSKSLSYAITPTPILSRQGMRINATDYKSYRDKK